MGLWGALVAGLARFFGGGRGHTKAGGPSCDQGRAAGAVQGRAVPTARGLRSDPNRRSESQSCGQSWLARRKGLIPPAPPAARPGIFTLRRFPPSYAPPSSPGRSTGRVGCPPPPPARPRSSTLLHSLRACSGQCYLGSLAAMVLMLFPHDDAKHNRACGGQNHSDRFA